MDKAKIEKLLDNLTLGLKADPEIRLDVKSELRSHLDAKIEEGIKSGLSENESKKQALKAFGDIIKVSDGIADANSAKMSLKARLRVFAGFLLVPAVIICALINFTPVTLSNLSMYKLLKIVSPNDYNSIANNYDKTFWLFDRYTPEEEFILYGDKSKKTKAEQQKAIWIKYPENKVYLANYIMVLLSQNDKSGRWRKKIFAELKMAKQIDPDNAFYNYISAGLLLEKAYIINGKIKYKTEYSITIKNRKLMNQAVEEYLKGTQKKYYKTYIMDMHHCRLDIMGEAKSFVQNIRQIAIFAGILLPHLSSQRNIARATWKYAGILQKEGKEQEALRIVGPWKIYIKQITEDSNVLISVLVDTAIAQVGKKEIPEVYRKAGMVKLAEKTKSELEKIITPVKNWKAEVRQFRLKPLILKKTGVLVALLLPALGKLDITEEDYAISNKIEYTAVEKVGIVLINLFFVIAMLATLLTALYWRIRSKQKALLLAPSPQLVGKVFLLGIILPLITYILISISEIIGGHEYNIMYNAVGLGAQFTILLTVITATIFILIRKHVHQRCIELDLPCPEIKKNKMWRRIAVITLVLLAIFACGPLKISDSTDSFKLPLIIIALISVVLLFLYIVKLIAEYLITLFSGKKYALYYGALAKTLTPIFALAMIFMTLIVIPYLDWRESDLISKDKIIYGQSRCFTPAEYRLTQRLKAAMLKALE